MPLFSRPIQATDPILPTDLILNQPVMPPTGGELAGALYRTSWTGGLVDWATTSYAQMKGAGPKADPNYVYDMKQLPKRYHEISDDVADATSDGEVQGLFAKHDAYLNDQETIANAGVDGIFYGGLTALLDPVTLPLWFMPFGKGFQMAGTLQKMGRLTGLTVAEMAAGEAIMHHIDMARDPNETRKNLFIAASVSSAMGAFLGRMGKNLPQPIKDGVADEFGRQAGRKYDEGVLLYHGTHPDAVFDIVDLKYVGTGEGKQFQGWGLYMASRKGIAAWYAETVSMGTMAAAGNASREYQTRVNWLVDLIGKRTGHVYEMEVMDSALKRYLDWSKKLSGQEPDVLAALQAENHFGVTITPNMTGHSFYRALTRKIQTETGMTFGEAQREASTLMKNAGIKGNKYLDRPSRKPGIKNPTYNFVAFDSNDIRVLKRNRRKINDPTHIGIEMTPAEAMTEVSAALTGRSVGAMEAKEQWADVNMEAPQKDLGVHKAMVRTPQLRMAYTTEVGLAEPAAVLPHLTQSGIEKNKYLLGQSEEFNPIDFVVHKERRDLGNTRFAIKQAKKEILKNHKDELTEMELRQIISKAAAYGDDAGMNPYPELQSLIDEARAFRIRYENRMKSPRVGMMDEEVGPKWNKFYGPRNYDVEAVKEAPELWEKQVVLGYRAQGDTRTTEELIARAREASYNLSTISKSGGGGDFKLKRPFQTTAGRLKQITLEIEDKYIEDFLVRDVINDHDSMIRNLLPEIILRERYGDLTRTAFGFDVPFLENRFKDEFREKHARLLDTYKKAKTKAEAATTPEAKTRYEKSAQRSKKKADKMVNVHEQSLRDLRHILQKISGVGEHSTVLPAGVAEFLGELRGYAQGAHLGNSAVASLHEPITMMMVQGFTPLAKQASIWTRNWEKLSASELPRMRAAGLGMDLRATQTTALMRAEVDGATLTRGWKSWGRRKVAPFMYKWNGQNGLNAIYKTGAGGAMGDMIVRHALGKPASKIGSAEYLTEVSFMTRHGIGSGELKMIKAELDKGKYTEIEDVYFAAFDEFDDPYLSARFADALAMTGETTIIGHSAGSVPAIFDNPIGRMFTMYRNVFFNMQGKTIIPVAQRLARGDLRTAQFLTASFGVAWMIYQFRLMGRVGWDMDKFQEQWDKMAIQDHVRESIAASGLFGLTDEMLGAADNLSGGNASKLLGLNESTKNYFNRNLGLTGLSPAVSWADKVVRGTAGAMLTEGKFTQKDINGLMYSLPGRSIPYLDPAFDAIQSSVIDYFPESANPVRERRTR